MQRWRGGKQPSATTINATDAAGQTPLHLASIFDRITLMELLLRNHADPSIRDAKGRPPLHLLYQSVPSRGAADLDREHVNEALLHRLLYPPAATGSPIDINEPDDKGDTILHLTVRARLEHSVVLLLRLGSDPSARNSSGETPLHVVAHARPLSDYAAVVDGLLLERMAEQDRLLSLLSFGPRTGETVSIALEEGRDNMRKERDWAHKLVQLRSAHTRETARIEALPAHEQWPALEASKWNDVNNIPFWQPKVSPPPSRDGSYRGRGRGGYIRIAEAYRARNLEAELSPEDLRL